MNQKQSWEEEFDKKAELSFARGGFLVTDYPRENGINHWCLDPLSIKDFIKQAIQTREREIKDNLKNAICYHDDSRGLLISSPPQKQCVMCGRRWIAGEKPPVCDYIRKEDILNLNHQ